MAAGVTLAPGTHLAFLAFLSARLGEAVAANRERDGLAIDALLAAGGATPDLVASLDRAGPYGAGAPEPAVALQAHTIADAAIVGAGHVRVRLRAGDGASIAGVAFRAAQEPLGQALLSARGGKLHIAGTLSINRWGGTECSQLRIIDAAVP